MDLGPHVDSSKPQCHFLSPALGWTAIGKLLKEEEQVSIFTILHDFSQFDFYKIFFLILSLTNINLFDFAL